MKKALALSWIPALLLPLFPAQAGIPSAINSSITYSAPGAACQYRFLPDGGPPGDVLVVTVTVLDALFAPCWPCAVTVTLVPQPGTTFCTCCLNPQTITTNVAGVATFHLSKIGGCGQLSVDTVACGGVALGSRLIDFTSPDLNGSCDAVGSFTTVADLGKFAAGLPPGYDVCADYDCSLIVNVVDLGFWASGLGRNCNFVVCP